MSQDGSTFQTHRNHISPYYPKEPVIFPYLRQYHFTPSLINNQDSEPRQDIFSQSTPHDFETFLIFLNDKLLLKLSPIILSPTAKSFLILPLLMIIMITHLTLSILTLERFKMLYIIQTLPTPLFLNYIHVLPILQLLLSPPHQILKSCPFILELLIPHILTFFSPKKLP